VGVGSRYVLNTDALVYTTESLKDKETSILYEIIQAGNEEEIISQDLKQEDKHKHRIEEPLQISTEYRVFKTGFVCLTNEFYSKFINTPTFQK